MGHIAIAGITDPSGQVWVAGGGGAAGSGGAGGGGGGGGGRRPGGRGIRTLSQFPDNLSWAEYKQRVTRAVQGNPGLADTISEDREGTKARAEIERWVATAVVKLDRDAPIVACLACTHYGYRKDFFAAALGPGAVVIDPNESAVGDLFPRGGASHDVDVELVTRYALPPATVETLTWLLREISPRTVAAMQHFVHVPDLF